VLDVLRRSQVPEQLGRPLRPVGRLLDRVTRPFGLAEHPLIASRTRERTGDVFFAGVLAVLVAYGTWEALGYVRATTGLGEFGYAFALGAATFARVIVLVAFATVVWVPMGVWIGMNPKVTRIAQPIVQVLASFPANFIFPFATIVFVAWHIPSTSARSC
jgi:NitT/TauT family transport system permease protein